MDLGLTYSSRATRRISASACSSRANSLGFQRFSPPILWGLQGAHERFFRLSRLRMVCRLTPHASRPVGRSSPLGSGLADIFTELQA
jgi:hypothetical protein